MIKQNDFRLVYSVPFISDYCKRIKFAFLHKEYSNIKIINIKKQIISLYFDFLEFTEYLINEVKHDMVINKPLIFGHNDLKPENLLFFNDKIKIFDLDSFDFFILSDTHINTIFKYE